MFANPDPPIITSNPSSSTFLVFAAITPAVSLSGVQRTFTVLPVGNDVLNVTVVHPAEPTEDPNTLHLFHPA
jgi:hypothetical protein